MKKPYTPERNDIVWIDFEPTKGKEIGKYRPAYVLSTKEYNQKYSLVICCPISTAARGNLMEVPLENLEKPSVVVTSIVNTLSWKDRQTKFIAQAEDGVMEAVLQRIVPLIGADKLLLQSAGVRS